MFKGDSNDNIPETYEDKEINQRKKEIEIGKMLGENDFEKMSKSEAKDNSNIANKKKIENIN